MSAKDATQMDRKDAFDWEEAIGRARAESPFLSRALDRNDELAALLASGDEAAAFDYVARAGIDAPDLSSALRRERLALSTVLAIGDLAGVFPLERVTGELSQFADNALARAIEHAIEGRVGQVEPQGFVAIALGKQGAHELNYSSDIDPILLFDPERLPKRASDDVGETAQRYAKKIVALLAENTAEGFVFRVDLRLRPASEISPLAVPLPRARSHYQSSALAWERAAFIKARACAGDIAAGEAFLSSTIKPFVWRSSLDFGAVEEIRRLTAQIRDHHAGQQSPAPGFDVKRGRGGIREIEFFAQTHQMIHGGRDPSLRVRGTKDALRALAAGGYVEEADAEMLCDCYDRLRQVEHRLQMVHDRQTHSLPSGEALDSVARLDGLADGAALIEALSDTTSKVAKVYDRLIGETGTQGSHKKTQSAQPDQLADQFDEAFLSRIASWCDGRFKSLRTPQALAAFDTVMPALAEGFSNADDPERAMARWENMLERASSAIQLFQLLDARPQILRRLIGALTLAPTLADELARKPELLDILIDEDALELPGDVQSIINQIEERSQRDDYEARLDAIRTVVGELRFALGIQLVERHHDALDIARGLSRLAEAAIEAAVRAARDEFSSAHGAIPESELVIVGLGRLGGGLLTHASDLDMIYLFTGDFDQQSDGRRPLGATLYFNRLATRVSAALSVPTAQGALYEVDTRLRPQGNQGPLAVSCDSFAKYQREAAWTWEHMALARGRVLVGSDRARQKLNDIIADVLGKQRDPVQLRADVLKMRADMAEHKPATGPLDVKLLRGGLVDIEFMTHFLQLRDAHMASEFLSPDLDQALLQLVEAELLPLSVLEASRLMTRTLIAERLFAPDGQEPPTAAAKAMARACDKQSMDELLDSLAVARQNVAASWAHIFAEKLELD